MGQYLSLKIGDEALDEEGGVGEVLVVRCLEVCVELGGVVECEELYVLVEGDIGIW